MSWIQRAKIGDRVVCINDDWDGHTTMGSHSIPIRVPMIGEVLTISEVVAPEKARFKQGGVGLVFEEIAKHQADGPISGDVIWGAHCFGPLKDRPTSISIFEKLLQSAPSDQPLKEEA